MVRKNFKNEIVFANVILCLLVVFIHVSSHPIQTLQKDSWAFLLVFTPWRLSAFVVQGFLFLSAFKIFIKAPISDYKSYYISKLKHILLPYVLCTIIYYLYYCYIKYFPFSFMDLAKYLLTGSIVSPFYFIIIILQFYLLTPLWQTLYRKSSPTIIILISFVFTVLFKQLTTSLPYMDRVFPTYLIFWSLGAVCGLYYDSFKNNLKKNIFIIVIVFLCFCVTDLFFSYKTFTQGISFSFLETLHLIYCITAILFIIGIGFYIKERKILYVLNSITFEIYLSHCFVMVLVDRQIAKLGIYSVANSYVIRFFAVYVITISLCLIYKKLLNSLPKKTSMIK